MSETPTHFPESELPENRVEAKPSLDDFRQVAEGIANSLAQGLRRHEKKGDTRNETKRFFIDEETNPDLQDLAKILMTAPAVASLDRQFEERKLDNEDKHLSAEEQAREKEISASVKKPLIDYNHLVRDFVEGNADSLDREEFASWLGHSTRNFDWADKVVNGMAAEIAAEDYLATLPEVSGVRPATNGEDSLGIDLVAEMQDGTRVCLDIKSGRAQPPEGVEPGRYSVKVGIPTDAVEQWRIAPEYRELVHHRFRQALVVNK